MTDINNTPELNEEDIEDVVVMTDEEGNLRKDLTNDGLHLLPEAYEIWIEILRPYINE